MTFFPFICQFLEWISTQGSPMMNINFFSFVIKGHPGGSVGWASDFFFFFFWASDSWSQFRSPSQGHKFKHPIAQHGAYLKKFFSRVGKKEILNTLSEQSTTTPKWHPKKLNGNKPITELQWRGINCLLIKMNEKLKFSHFSYPHIRVKMTFFPWNIQSIWSWDTCLAQSVERVTSDLEVVSLSSMLALEIA